MATDIWICPGCSHFLPDGTCNCWPVVCGTNEQSCYGVLQCEYRTARVTACYAVFDSRACGGQGTDDALVLLTAESLDEARDLSKGMGMSACYRLTIELGKVVEQVWIEDFEME